MKQNFQPNKYVPFLIGLVVVAAALVGIMWIISQPEVIMAWAEWLNSRAALFSAQQVYHTQLPDILTNWTWLIIGGALSLAVFAFILSTSVSLVLHNVDRVVSHGLEFEKNVNGQKTTYKLIQTNPTPHKSQLPSGSPRVTVDEPVRGALGRGSQQLPPKSLGRKLNPEERTAPGRTVNHNQHSQSAVVDVPQSLGGGEKSKVSKDDPLAELIEDTVI